MAMLAIGWWFSDMDEDRGVGIYPPDADKDELRRVVMIAHWSDPVDREVTTTYWVDGQRHAGLQEDSLRGEWREWFLAAEGTEVRVLAENVDQGGRLSCFLFAGPPGNEILVREMHRVQQDIGDCELFYRVGDPPYVQPID